ncbi:DUF3347 domain-containing protein [Leptospira sp. 201903070]|uniref:DUF3347 domain-containing protein n=2 Tax=Leptospira ainlahdjerensis TaxID=2810033 RepID=A0ABS2UAX9_9LEPT|nr:DUF3347 domain-containing protein [Leptospira ainlahdjerensis]MBM9577529.1 DUF3347 domain-containing protein [Leptospira ainlahdjerensis]
MFRPFVISAGILVLLTFCVKQRAPITEPEKDALQSILIENESIHNFLMKEEEKIPDVSKLETNVQALIQLNGGLKNEAEKMLHSLRKKDSKDVEKFFEAYSSFSETLAESVKLAGGNGVFNKFYCPMVKKTWVKQGTQIQNPYAPEMRDCGDLVP